MEKLIVKEQFKELKIIINQIYLWNERYEIFEKITILSYQLRNLKWNLIRGLDDYDIKCWKSLVLDI